MEFAKMQGAGNDFIVIDNRKEKLTQVELGLAAEELCRRRFSVGADGLMAVEEARSYGNFRMAFFNADGSPGEMCGNGARCIARYAYEKGLTGGRAVIETDAGPVETERLSREIYAVKLNEISRMERDILLETPHGSFLCTYVELGNPPLPHLVTACPGLREIPAEKLRAAGSALRGHPALPKGANVNFYDVEADGRIFERTFERGVEDFTFACGTGTVCLAAVLTDKGLVKTSPVSVEMAGGRLSVEIEKTEESFPKLRLIGPAVLVAEGQTEKSVR